MTHLIDKGALVTEIKKYKNNAEAYLKYHHNRNDKLVHSFEQEKLVMCELLSFLDTLEVKKVDLDNELDFVKDAYYYFTSDERSSMKKVAKHFFELGRVASSKEQKGKKS